MKYGVTFEGQIGTENHELVPAEQVERDLERVLDELFALEAAGEAEDSTVAGALSQGIVEISVTVEAETVDDAQQRGAAVIRSAIHATGARTPDWDIDWVAITTRRSDRPADHRSDLVGA